jgi:hypothetical protein
MPIKVKRETRWPQMLPPYVIRIRTIGVMSASSATIGRSVSRFLRHASIPRWRFKLLLSILDFPTVSTHQSTNQTTIKSCSHDHSSRFDLFSLRLLWE